MNKWLKALLWTAGILAVLGGVARALFLRPWKVPADAWLGASVAPTMAAGDQVLLLTAGEPRFGDLVRCSDPVEGARFVVGRIVGLGGDEIIVDGDNFRVNGVAYNRSASCDKPKVTVVHPTSKGEVELECGIVNLAGGWHYVANFRSERKTQTTVRVAPGHYFLLSDNRVVHDDSRDFGQVPVELCKARPVFRLWGDGGWTDADTRMTLLR